MLDQITELLENRGYEPIDNETDGILIRQAERQIYAVTLSYASEEEDTEEYVAIQRRLEFVLATRFMKKVECLHIVLTRDGMFGEAEHALIEQLPNVWLVAQDTGKIYIFERQITDFDGLFDELENGLRQSAQHIRKRAIWKVAPVNVGIVALNILIYIAVILIHGDMLAVYDTDIMLSMGALSYETFMAGAWYQVITSMFLHFGLDHLGNNMLILAYTGYELEKRIGSIPYLLIYVCSGVAGSIASLVYYHSQSEVFVGAGASGAIYGVIGALLVILIVLQIRTPELSPRRIFVMIVISIYHGLTSTGVGNAAHIGGLLTGIIGGILLSKILQYGKLKEVSFTR